MRRFALLMLGFCAALALAQSAEYRNEAAAAYRTILAGLAAKGKLDDDGALLARVRRISPGLIAAAAQMRAETAAWSWEMHVTSDPAKGTFCMAGGKVLVGAGLVKRLALDDGELAMLLGHEIAHAVADHRRAPSRLTMESDATEERREAALALAQEEEADRIGMQLAHRAGWPAAKLATFFDKLVAQESAGTFSASHPTAAARAAAAQVVARTLGD
ncbi:MAG TPA: M48 family metalloprotease [Usitatibacter sp.]